MVGDLSDFSRVSSTRSVVYFLIQYLSELLNILLLPGEQKQALEQRMFSLVNTALSNCYAVRGRGENNRKLRGSYQVLL